MEEAQYLAGRILLAMPGMFDRRFARTVNVMCVHDANGALGIDVGHLRDGVRLHAILNELEIDPGVAPDCPIHHGGPVEPGRGFVLHSDDWSGADTVAVPPIGAMSASLEVLRAIAEGRGPSRWLIALGYAGWGPGQLEGEMTQHGWYAAQGTAELIFDTGVEGRWMAAWRAEGIDPAQLSPQAGRA